MRPFEQADAADEAEAGGAFRGRQRLQLGEPPPPQQLGDPRRDHEEQREHEDQAQPIAPAGRGEERAGEETARGRKQQIASGGERRVPGLHRFQRGIDHRRAVDGDHRERRARQPGDHDMAAAPPRGDGQADQRRESGDRQHAFARQPARPPLGQRPPGALRIAEMQRRGQQPAGNQRQRQQVGELGGERGGIEQAEPEQRGKPVAEAGQRREDDDRRRGMHGSGGPAERGQVAGVEFLRAPLCPAGHLPLKGGDRQLPALALSLQRRRLAKAAMTANLPPCGGDVRQDRGG